MSRNLIRNLIVFLLVNAILAIFLSVNFFMKAHNNVSVVTLPVPTTKVIVDNKVEEPLSTTSASTVAITPEDKVKATPNNTHLENKLVETTKENTKDNICVELGPFNIEQKGTMDFILNKNKQTNLAKFEKRITYQLFWNLGSNKLEAEKAFKKQKEGPMADSKFALTQAENKDWIVNIVKVNNSFAIAEKLAKDLAEKAQKINAGGKWESKVLPEGYFYIFNDFKKLNDATTTSIDVMLSPTKNPC